MKITGKAAIIVIDMLNDFCHPDGSLFVPNSLATIKPICDLLHRNLNTGTFHEGKISPDRKPLPVFFTNDAHEDDDLEFKIWPRHCVKDTWGARVIDQIKDDYLARNSVTVEKLRYDPFYQTSLDHQLRVAGVDTVILVGTVANICVLAAAHSAALRWYNVVVPLDCVSALDDKGLEVMKHQVTTLYQGTLVERAEEIDW